MKKKERRATTEELRETREDALRRLIREKIRISGIGPKTLGSTLASPLLPELKDENSEEEDIDDWLTPSRL